MSAPLERLGLPQPSGWSIERVVPLTTDTAVVARLALGRTRNARWRLVTA